MMIVQIFAWFLALPMAVLLAYATIEIMLGLTRLSPTRFDKASSAAPSYAVLIPAHNEAAGITDTVQGLRQQTKDAHIIVVADNCSDATAQLARDAGADVIVRDDPDHRGKGYALAYGRDYLDKNPPEAVIIVDADCQLDPGSAERLAAHCVSTERAVQSANLLAAEHGSSPMVAISNLAMLVKNLVRARGMMRLGGGASLFGTGMAFPWPLFARLPLATDDAVEDIKLGLWLARQRIPALLDDGARVMSPAAPIEASKGQRSRWEHGFLAMARHEAAPLLWHGVVSGSRHMVALAMHLLVPPLALLVLLSVAIGMATALFCAVSGYWLPAAVIALAFGAFLVAILLAWLCEGRSVAPLSALLQAPFYIIWKIPIYLGFFTNRQTGWNRTRRKGDKDEA